MTTTKTKTNIEKSQAPVPNVAPKITPKVAAKAVAKPATKAATKPIVKAPAEKEAAPKNVSKTTSEKPLKVKKIKMVQDRFTMPKPEFAVVDVLKLRAAQLSGPIKKSELIRAGIKALAAMTDADFLLAIRAVPNLKTDRPEKA